jgi:hypothetical protein
MVSHLRVADVLVDDDPFGEDRLTLSGTDAAFFELVGTLTSDGDGVSLYLKAGTVLSNVSKPSYSVTVNVIDDSISGAVQDSDSHTLSVTAVEGPPHPCADESACLARMERGYDFACARGRRRGYAARARRYQQRALAHRRERGRVRVGHDHRPQFHDLALHQGGDGRRA